MQMRGCFWELQEVLGSILLDLIYSGFQQIVEWVTVTGVKSVTVIPKLSILFDTQWDDTINSQFSSTVLIKF